MALRWHPNRLNSQPCPSATAIFQLLDTNGALVSEFYLGASRTISVVANEGATNTRIEASTLANNSLIVRVNDTGPVTITHGSFATSQPPGSAHERRAAN